MKVVLSCGRQGIRLRDHSELMPKPMITIGYQPILWHVVRYHAHFGHRRFILCLPEGRLHAWSALKDLLEPRSRWAPTSLAAHVHDADEDHPFVA